MGVLNSPDLDKGKDFVTIYNSWPKSMTMCTWFSRETSATLRQNSATLKSREKRGHESFNRLSSLSVKGPDCRIGSILLVIRMKGEEAGDLENLVNYSELETWKIHLLWLRNHFRDWKDQQIRVSSVRFEFQDRLKSTTELEKKYYINEGVYVRIDQRSGAVRVGRYGMLKSDVKKI